MKYWNKKKLKYGSIRLSQHKKLTCNDFQTIYKLLEAGYPLQIALQFLPKDKCWILESLNQGIDFIDILKQQNTSIAKNICFFCSITTLSNAIQISNTLNEFNKKMVKTLFTKSCYPCILIICSFFLIKLFSNVILPQIISGFTTQQIPNYLISLIQYFNIFINLFLFMLIIIICIYILVCTNKNIQSKLLYILGSKLTCVKNYCSYVFANYINELEKNGISTYHSIQYLQNINILWLKQLAFRLYQELVDGNGLIDSIENEKLFSQDFIHCMKLRSVTQISKASFDLFFIQQQEYWNKFLKKILIYLFGFTYLFIGIAVSLTFQIMLIPLQFVETF